MSVAGIEILANKCTGCGVCVEACPFGAIACEGGVAQVNAACRVCKLCIKRCPTGAISVVEQTARDDRAAYRDLLVYVEHTGGRIHPITFELIGKAHDLAKNAGYRVHALLIGHGLQSAAQELHHYGLTRVLVCDDARLAHFVPDAYTNAFCAALEELKPAAVLVGATVQGRSLAPCVATRLGTGLTADCTALEMRENGELVQIRPAFGGNIMARILTPYTRPQFATVHYKIFDRMAPRAEAAGAIQAVSLPDAALCSRIEVLDVTPKPASQDISDAEVIVVAGRGAQQPQALAAVRALADALGAQMAYTRPLVENRAGEASRQIGLSGKTVKAKLLIACGVSGAVQFTAGMKECAHIIAINSDAEAPIFEVAHVGLVGDVAATVPALTALLKGGAA